MALQSSGAISLSEVQSTHGGSNPIGMSEYYLNGDYVDSTKTETTAAASSSLTSTTFNSSGAGYYYAYSPTINPGSVAPPSYALDYNPNGCLFYVAGHRDNGATGNWAATFTVDTTGVYGVKLTQHNNGGATLTYTYTITGSSSGTLLSESISYYAASGTNKHTDRTFSAVANETLTCTGSWNSSGHSVCAMYVGGYTSPHNNKTVQITTSINSDVPSSSTISMSDFHGTE